MKACFSRFIYSQNEWLTNTYVQFVLSFVCTVQASLAVVAPIPLQVVVQCSLTETPKMPLFGPILRLAMLFLNVYDSYKTLKFPPPSSKRNDGLPSVRAMTQRKRDMKGCLAVWIVWVRYIVC